MEYVILMKEDFGGFIARLAKLQKLAAPVSKGYNNFSFQEVRSGDEIALKYIPTIIPPKKFFMPRQETLLEFNIAKGLDVKPVVEHEKITLFGVHTCDLAGIQCLNMALSIRPRDYNYLIRKRKIDIIGLECNEYCDEYASCCLVSSHLPNGGYDLFFTDLCDYFMVHVNTQAGEDMVESARHFRCAEDCHLEELRAFRERKRVLFKNEVPIESRLIPEMFDRAFESPVWKDLEERCLACGNCTNVCPTCYCFDIMDEMDMNLKMGRRYRNWDSCQLEPFAKVAGGENFRKERSARQRHRYYRKFRYPVSKFARFFCTGCGRCSRACMAGINLKETLNALLMEVIT
ncbi:MAG TPA: Ni/Fe hydrogenase subunit beta [Nitrospiraceae bacterium]|nr:MAG: Ni/Fe hydrogenase subunit beta [Nitrospirae bacterium GWA2_46_11]OGW24776.1 MAG: Ni/Fe hydrogenase subunit beta [Nitrospirae bacterium GWB2_47_37]HAK88466.1 Ni/Fe hydrogenase subunit beta [Nitrospiraceae bacterium]HCZ12177.1 Ni/Fe hydrogenase subunit beta [Nitrospiraceae bacterium]